MNSVFLDMNSVLLDIRTTCCSFFPTQSL